MTRHLLRDDDLILAYALNMSWDNPLPSDLDFLAARRVSPTVLTRRPTRARVPRRVGNQAKQSAGAEEHAE